MILKIDKFLTDNLIFGVITLAYLAAPAAGLILTLLYLLFAVLKPSRMSLLLPAVYLSVNTALGNKGFLGVFTHWEMVVVVTAVVCVAVRQDFLSNLSRFFGNGKMVLAADLLLLVCCYRTDSGKIVFGCLILMQFLAAGCAGDAGDLDEILTGLVVAGNQVVLVGVLELALQRTFFYSAWTGAERYRYGMLRIGSTAADPNYICLVLVPLLLVCYWLYCSKGERRYLCCMALYGLLAVLTISRTGILCLIVTVYILVRRHWFLRMRQTSRWILNILLVCTAVLLAAPFLEIFAGMAQGALKASNFTRNVCLGYAVALVKKYPWTGLGLNQFYRYAQPLFYHEYGGKFAEGITVMNLPLEIAVAFGIMGLAAFGLLVFKAFHCCKRHGQPEQELMPCLGYGLGIFLLISLTLDGMTYALFWWFLTLPVLAGNVSQYSYAESLEN